MGAGLLVHIATLPVPVRMLGPLQPLVGALQRVALLLQQPPDGVVTDRMTLRRECLGQLPRGLARPAQRTVRIPAGVGIDQGVQRRKQARVAGGPPLGPTARTADAATRVGSLLQLPHPGVDRRARQPTDAGHPRAAAMAQRPRARTGQQAALLLGQVRSDQLVQPGQHGVDLHPATLPSQQAPAATIGQTSHAGTLMSVRSGLPG